MVLTAVPDRISVPRPAFENPPEMLSAALMSAVSPASTVIVPLVPAA